MAAYHAAPGQTLEPGLLGKGYTVTAGQGGNEFRPHVVPRVLVLRARITQARNETNARHRSLFTR